MKTVDASVSRGIWAFTHHTEKKILEAYKVGKCNAIYEPTNFGIWLEDTTSCSKNVVR